MAIDWQADYFDPDLEPPSNGLAIRARRQRAGMTQQQLADKAGISVATLSSAEQCGLVTERTAERLASALGCGREVLEIPAGYEGRGGRTSPYVRR